MSRYVFGDSPYWDAAIERYLEDEVVEALALVQRRGIGDGGEFGRWFRVLEAEGISRVHSRTKELGHGLTLEYIPEEVLSVLDVLTDAVTTACLDVAQRFAYTGQATTRIAIMAEVTEGPWTVSPYGYCVEKGPYHKICLPAYLLDELDEAAAAVAHEYAHVVCLELTDGHAPRWLEEAISMLVEHGDSLSDTVAEWRNPIELERLLQAPSDDPESEAEPELWDAYVQCGWIGRYLHSLRGDEGIAELMTLHADERWIQNLSLALTGRQRVDYALSKAFGLTVRQLFDRARPE